MKLQTRVLQSRTLQHPATKTLYNHKHPEISYWREIIGDKFLTTNYWRQIIDDKLLTTNYWRKLSINTANNAQDSEQRFECVSKEIGCHRKSKNYRDWTKAYVLRIHNSERLSQGSSLSPLLFNVYIFSIRFIPRKCQPEKRPIWVRF